MSFFKWLSNKINPPRVRLVFTTQKNEYFLGEQIKGELEISSEEDFDADKIVVGLSCWEDMKKTRSVTTQYGDSRKQHQEQYWDRAELYKDSCVVIGASHVPQGYSSKFPFALKIPSVTRETYYSVDNNVKWWMTATLIVRGRPSVQTEMREILVAKQEAVPQPPSTITKEVVREVVLIPCSYCGSLMPQASIFCPNCGARRKS